MTIQNNKKQNVKKIFFYIITVLFAIEAVFFALGLFNLHIVDFFFDGESILFTLVFIILPTAILSLIYFFLYRKEVKLPLRILTILKTPVYFYITDRMPQPAFDREKYILLAVIFSVILLGVIASQIIACMQYKEAE